MEKNPGTVTGNNDQIELPAGFRFHPTDEELITHYLAKKVLDNNFSALAISDVDMNKVEPWDLPWKAKIGEDEWYFFCIKDKKYPTGQRTNRATSSGYWKATGKDKEIVNGKTLVGMKKTLVFYKGRAPKGVKTNWVSHEYRLDGAYAIDDHLPKLSDWVIMRVFHKTSSGKKVHISGLIRPLNPKLVSSSSSSCSARSSHVPCFSSSINQDDFTTCFNNPIIVPESITRNPYVDSFNWGQIHGAAAALSTENASVVSGKKKSYEEEEEPTCCFEANDLDFTWNF